MAGLLWGFASPPRITDRGTRLLAPAVLSSARLLVMTSLLLMTLVAPTQQNTRQRRDINTDQPKIVSQGGHLIFQTAENHNITFRSSGAGTVLLNGEDLNQVVQQTRTLRTDVDQLKAASTTTNLDSRVRTLESRSNSFTSTINQFYNRINTIQTRLTNIEAAMNSTNMADVSQRLNTLTQRFEQLNNLLTVNECTSAPCRNGATCLDLFGSFHCQCQTGWTGRLCDTDVNECATLVGTDLGCQNGATCQNTLGSFTCVCPPNFYGTRCTEMHDDCSTASNVALCAHGTCHNVPRSVTGQANYRCFCEPGWTTSGFRPECNVDVNECTAARPPCSANPPVFCINTPGSFACGPCPPGYSGNGYVCVDINECEVNNGGCSVAPHVECTNTIGARQCGPCPPGYQGDGFRCAFVGVCGQNNGGCSQFAICRETPGITSRSCQCFPGYQGNGEGPTGCVSLGPPSTTGCANNPCGPNGVCTPVAYSYQCACNLGWTGPTCTVRANPCDQAPCRNGGTCQLDLSPEGYRCTCTAEYTGPNCLQIQETCGGQLRAATGSISFPRDSVGQYPHGADCVWTITTRSSQMLALTFTRFHLEVHSTCGFDSVQLYDGATTSSRLIGKYCGTTLPNGGSAINTTLNQVTLWFQSDSSISGDGFNVSWISANPTCGGAMIGPSQGVISSPGYPGNYPNDRDCIWIVGVPLGHTITFTFGHIQLEPHSNCTMAYDFVEVRDGRLESARQLARYCAPGDPPAVDTTGPYAYVRFHSDHSNNDIGFQLHYMARAGCGQSFMTDNGVLISPNYPNPYPHEAQCIWTITVPAGEVITFSVTNIDLEQHNNCLWDYLEVRDGPDGSGSFVGRYCGNSTPPVYVSATNTLWVKFKSDASNRGAGFRATWTVACGGVFTNPAGEIKSPYFPNAYPSDKECVYIIRQPEGSIITLSFISFDIEASYDPNCTHDSLEIRNGETADSPLIGRLCGSMVPAPIQSSGSSLWLKFTSDDTVHNHGFRATYETTNNGGGGTPTGPSGSCGGSLVGQIGTFQSPFHPNVYPHGVNCTWFITVLPGFIIRLTFNAFTLENHYSCAWDYVEIFDNVNSTGSFGRYCGTNRPPVITSTNNVLRIAFVTDSSVATEGFSASYVALNATTVCGGELRNNIGLIQSPNYPNNYPHSRTCEWTIVLATGKLILLNVTNFVMEYSPTCAWDFLEIRNGGFSTSPLIGKYCGTTIDRTIVSHSNRLYLKMQTDSSSAHPGFQIYYDGTVAGCGGEMTSSTGSFVSPNYPLAYGRNAECLWTIIVANGSTIRLQFVDFEMEQHATCRYDYVQVREQGPLGNQLAMLCGNSTPDFVQSTSNRMWVKFRTDWSNHGRGFHATYYASCNNVLSGHMGVIETPNYPNPYPRNRDCTWTIQATLGNTVNATFTNFELEAGTSSGTTNASCQHDYVEIRDGSDLNSNLIGRYCGQNVLPPPIASTGRVLLIRFVSDSSVSHNGFRLEYITNGCGGLLTAPTGNFTSLNYPNNYPHSRECAWLITVALPYRVHLIIDDFAMEAHPTCDFDGLEVRPTVERFSLIVKDHWTMVDDDAHDRDEQPHRHYHRLVAAFQRSWIDTMSLLRSIAESRS